jgi:hypothetical protein
VGEVLKIALTRQPEAIDWVAPEIVPAVPMGDGESDSMRTH